MSSFLSAAENVAGQRQNVRRDLKKMEEESSCCLLHLGDISEKVVRASYDTLIYILNLVCQIFTRPLC